MTQSVKIEFIDYKGTPAVLKVSKKENDYDILKLMQSPLNNSERIIPILLDGNREQKSTIVERFVRPVNLLMYSRKQLQFLARYLFKLYLYCNLYNVYPYDLNENNIFEDGRGGWCVIDVGEFAQGEPGCYKNMFEQHGFNKWADYGFDACDAHNFVKTVCLAAYWRGEPKDTFDAINEAFRGVIKYNSWCNLPIQNIPNFTDQDCISYYYISNGKVDAIVHNPNYNK